MHTRQDIDCWRTFDGCARLVIRPDGEVLYWCTLARALLVQRCALSLRGRRLFHRDAVLDEAALARRCGTERIGVLHHHAEKLVLASYKPCLVNGARALALMLRLVQAGEKPAFACLGEAFQLTPAEEAIATRLLGGLPPAEIARQDGLSINTVRSHIAHLYTKLAVSNREEMWVRCAPFMVNRSTENSLLIKFDDANRLHSPYEAHDTQLS